MQTARRNGQTQMASACGAAGVGTRKCAAAACCGPPWTSGGRGTATGPCKPCSRSRLPRKRPRTPGRRWACRVQQTHARLMACRHATPQRAELRNARRSGVSGAIVDTPGGFLNGRRHCFERGARPIGHGDAKQFVQESSEKGCHMLPPTPRAAQGQTGREPARHPAHSDRLADADCRASRARTKGTSNAVTSRVSQGRPPGIDTSWVAERMQRELVQWRCPSLHRWAFARASAASIGFGTSALASFVDASANNTSLQPYPFFFLPRAFFRLLLQATYIPAAPGCA